MFNLLCRHLDAELFFFAESHGMRYTRYVDELVLSTRYDISPEWREEIKGIITGMDFTINPDKIRYYHERHGALHITGMSVHDGVARLSKQRIEQIRNFLHRARFDASIGRAEIEGVMGQARLRCGVFSPWTMRVRMRIPKRLMNPYRLALIAVEEREKAVSLDATVTDA